MKREDFLLLVVAAAKETPLTPIQLQKSLFLIGQSGLTETPSPFYEFEPYHYGPFDSEIYTAADRLHIDGLVARMPSLKGSFIGTAITPSGMEKADELYKTLRPEVATYIKGLVEWVQAQSFSSLLRAIYAQYPQFRANSVFQG